MKHLLLFMSFLTIASCAHAQTSFVTWNIAAAEIDDGEVAKRAQQMQDHFGAFDVLVLQEVVDEDQVAAAAQALGFEHWAISNFSPPVRITKNPFRSLEVAVLSKTEPIQMAIEWDTTGRLSVGDGYPPIASSAETEVSEIDIAVTMPAGNVSRGFLRVDFDTGISVYTAHWKSSRGAQCNVEDLTNAMKRETQSEGIQKDAEAVLQDGRSVVIAGDLNIQAPGDSLRSGVRVNKDCAPSGGTCKGSCGINAPGAIDGYDDSISMLMELTGARVLSTGLASTFVGKKTNAKAIDHIIVAGPLAVTFDTATIPMSSGRRYFGSDHVPVRAKISVSP